MVISVVVDQQARHPKDEDSSPPSPGTDRERAKTESY
jgi:hypothetical protein